MKKYLKICIYVLIFIAIIILSILGYNHLTTRYSPEETWLKGTEHTTKKALDFSVLNNSEETIHLSDFYGKPIIVNFWASWCGPCRTELLDFNEAYKKYNNEIEFMMVNLTDGYNDTVAGVKEFVQNNKYTFPLYFDTENSASNAYKLYSIPQTIFINSNGDILYSHIGTINSQVLEQYISELIGG